MTLLETFDDICSNKLPRRVEIVYADLESANRLIDQLKNSKYPVLLIVPYEVQDHISTSGLVKGKVPFIAYMVDKMLDQRTKDFTHKDAEAKAVEPMRTLARQFINFFNVSQIIDSETEGVVDVKYKPTYSSGDNSLFGVEINCTLPIVEISNTVCTD